MLIKIKTEMYRRMPIVDSIKALITISALSRLRRSVIELNDLNEVKKAFGWQFDPILDDASIDDYEYLEDANQRRRRDAEALGVVTRNSNPKICLDIGTSTGHSAALMAVNAPAAQVFTVNIPPEEILSGEGGKFTTIALEREKIGSYYRERQLRNITQILANTASWEPDFEAIDVAFIDGSHDTHFVYNDSKKALRRMRPGSFLLWHDFNLNLIEQHNWIHSVCLGVEKLIANGLISGPILHLRDSWIGIYRVTENDGQ